MDGTTRLISCRFARTIPGYNRTGPPFKNTDAVVCVAGIRDRESLMEQVEEVIGFASRPQSEESYRAARESILETVPLCIQTNPQ